MQQPSRAAGEQRSAADPHATPAEPRFPLAWNAVRGRTEHVGTEAPVAITDRTVRAWANRIAVNVKTAGSGPPVVFLHAAGGLVWDAFLDLLAEEYTVYAPEHPGTTAGDPDAIKPIDDLWDLVLLYYEVFDQLGLDRPAVVGSSFGGMVGAELAATEPNRVSKLVLIAPLGLWRDDAPIPNWMIMTPEELSQLIFHDPDGAVARQLLMPSEDEDERIEAWLSLTWSYACTGKFVWPIPDKGLRKRIHRIAAPTLLVWGKSDRLVPPLYAEDFARRIEGSVVEIVGRTGHLPHLEAIGTVGPLVRNFLRA